MTKRQLINAMRKMPDTAIVAWRDHDQSVGGINNIANNVELEKSEDMVDGECDYRSMFDNTKYVIVISP